MLGYQLYKNILTSIEEEGLLAIYDLAKGVVVGINEQLAKGQNLTSGTSIILETVIDVLHGIMNFPYLLNIMEFNSEMGLDDIKPIILPDSFQDNFIDFNFLESLLNMLRFQSVPVALKAKCLRVLSKLPAVRKSVTRNPAVSDSFMIFCMRSVEVILSTNFGNEGENSIDEVLDLISRLFLVYTVGELVRLPTSFHPFLNQLDSLLTHIFKDSYHLASTRSRQVNEILRSLLSESERCEDDPMSKLLFNAIRKYFEIFFSPGSTHLALIDESVIGNSDSKELKDYISGSLDLFEEAYRSCSDVKQTVLNELVPGFIQNFTVAPL